MMRITELREWLEVVENLGATEVWIDDGGLTLVADNDGTCEVGGEPDEDEDDEDDNEWEDDDFEDEDGECDDDEDTD